MKVYLDKTDNIKDFVQLFNEKETFASLEYKGENRLWFCYPQCYCACVKRVPKELSQTWCYCTLGNAEGIFHELMNRTVKATLIQSIKSGGEKYIQHISEQVIYKKANPDSNGFAWGTLDY